MAPVQGGIAMQFLVVTKASANPGVPVPVTTQLVRKTFEMLLEKRDPRIKQSWSFAGERAGAMIVAVGSAEELSDVIASLPFSGITDVSIHALTPPEQALKTLQQAEDPPAPTAPAP